MLPKSFKVQTKYDDDIYDAVVTGDRVVLTGKSLGGPVDYLLTRVEKWISDGSWKFVGVGVNYNLYETLQDFVQDGSGKVTISQNGTTLTYTGIEGMFFDMRVHDDKIPGVIEALRALKKSLEEVQPND